MKKNMNSLYKFQAPNIPLFSFLQGALAVSKWIREKYAISSKIKKKKEIEFPYRSVG